MCSLTDLTFMFLHFFPLYYRIIVTESDFQYVLQHLCHFAEP